VPDPVAAAVAVIARAETLLVEVRQTRIVLAAATESPEERTVYLTMLERLERGLLAALEDVVGELKTLRGDPEGAARLRRRLAGLGKDGSAMTSAADEARAAVHEYLDVQFPDGDIWDDGDAARSAARSAHTWSVEEHGVIMLLTVASEFLRDVPPENIGSLLSEWTIAELLRASGAAERLIVTTQGPHTEPR
jgi:hypothetical protein